MTFCIRTYHDVVRNWTFTIAPPAVSTALYILIFGKLIGSRIGPMQNLSYEQYVAPGLVLLPAITSAFSQAGFSLVVAKIWRLIDEYLITPQPGWMIVVSYVAGGVIRGVMVGITAAAVVLLFSHAHVAHVFACLGALALASLVAALAGFINGVFSRTLDQATLAPTFLITPLTYLGGVFYSVTLLPDWARTLSMADPVLYLVSLFRYTLSGTSDVSLGTSVLVMLVTSGILFTFATWLIKRGIGVRE